MGDIAAIDLQTIQEARLSEFGPLDPRRAPNKRDLILAMTETGANWITLSGRFLKDWVGTNIGKFAKSFVGHGVSYTLYFTSIFCMMHGHSGSYSCG